MWHGKRVRITLCTTRFDAYLFVRNVEEEEDDKEVENNEIRYIFLKKGQLSPPFCLSLSSERGPPPLTRTYPSLFSICEDEHSLRTLQAG